MIDTHSELLNVVLLETNPDSILGTAMEVEEVILNRRDSIGSRIAWTPQLEPSPLDSGGFYRPRTYALSGAFDVAAIYLAPQVEFGPWLFRSSSLFTAGHDINLCLLPTAATFDGKDDFNADFINTYGESLDEPRHGQYFVSILKVKLNSTFTWPFPERAPGRSEATRDGLRDTTRAVWDSVGRWRARCLVENEKSPTVALGISCGWNEILVVAHSDTPEKLLQLALDVRQLSAPHPSEADKEAHLCLTTLSSIGHDYRLSADLSAHLPDKTAKNPARDILNAVRALEWNEPPFYPEGSGAVPVFYQLGCHVYPGHERAILKLFSEIEQLLQVENDDPPSGFSVLETGKRDIWSPRIYSTESLPPQTAAVFVVGLQLWIRSRCGGAKLPPDSFDFYTRIGMLATEESLGSLQSLLNHATGIAKTHQIPSELGKYLDSAYFTRDVRASLRILQTPYALSEQIMHVFNTFYWAFDREILFEESAEIMPVIFALRNYLHARKEWWNEGQCAVAVTSHTRDAWHLKVNDELRALLDPNMESLLSAFRGMFYNRHLSNYLTDSQPDLNLRYRGSHQQMLGATQMILTLMIQQALGPHRAGMAVIGDSLTPEVQIASSIAVVKLGGGTLTQPILLETIGHEVGHQLLNEILRDREEPHWRKACGISPWEPSRHALASKLQASCEAVNHEIFLGRLLHEEDEQARLFIESASDFVEYKIWEYGKDDFAKWVMSFMLRSVSAAKPVTHPEMSKLPIPSLSQQLILSCITRCILVRIAMEMAEKDSPAIRDLTVLEAPLEELRRTLWSSCVVGTALRVVELLRNETAWRIHIEEKVHSLHWLRNASRRAQAADFYRSLSHYLEWQSEIPSPSSLLMASVRTLFREHRKSYLAQLKPSLFVATWMTGKQREEARAGALRHQDNLQHPWQAVPQPARYADVWVREGHEKMGFEGPELRTLIFQRGAVVPYTSESLEALSRADRQLWMSLFTRLPGWRKTQIDAALALATVD